jgi:hypothetical protein
MTHGYHAYGYGRRPSRRTPHATPHASEMSRCPGISLLLSLLLSQAASGERRAGPGAGARARARVRLCHSVLCECLCLRAACALRLLPRGTACSLIFTSSSVGATKRLYGRRSDGGLSQGRPDDRQCGRVTGRSGPWRTQSERASHGLESGAIAPAIATCLARLPRHAHTAQHT